MWLLEIELRSATCPGSGVGQPGQVDRELHYDEAGLPFIPGKRLKALLGEAYREVHGYFPELPGPEALFGAPGAAKTSSITVRRAEVGNSETIRTWLLLKDNPVRRQDVIHAFTEIRRQTAMDRDSGAPLENSLRSTRVLRKGLRFAAPLLGVTDSNRDAVQKAALALQSIGTARTRGLGEVSCRVVELPNAPVAVVANGGAAAEALGVLLETEDPVIFPVLAGDANTVLTDDHIPGSSIHGLLAGRYVEGIRCGVPGFNWDNFFRLFFSGDVRFLGGTPRIKGSEHRSARVPLSIREFKALEGCFVNLVSKEPEQPLRRVSRWCSLADLGRTGASLVAEVQKSLNYHNERARDQRIGRPVGEKYGEYPGLRQSEAGAFFTYESITERQSFDAEIQGPPTDLALLKSLVSGGEQVRLGRSRSAEYGGVRWSWGEPRATVAAVKEDVPVDRLVVTLLSDLIGYNEAGHPAPEFPMEELESALNVKVDRAEVVAYVRTDWQSGYFSHQRLPRQQTPTLAAGSVFVLPLVTASAVSCEGPLALGNRTEEGFGQVAVGVVPIAVNSLTPEMEVGDSVHRIEEQHPAFQLALQVYQTRILEDAVTLARKLSNSLSATVTSSLLSRVLLFLDRPTLAETAQELNALREPAKNRLKKPFVHHPRLWQMIPAVGETRNFQAERLFSFLKGVCGNPAIVYKLLTGGVYGHAFRHWNKAFRPEPELPPAFQTMVVRHFLRSFIRGVSARNRAARTPNAAVAAVDPQ